MTEAEIFPQRIAALAMRQGERTALTFVPGSGAPRTTSYAQLVARAASVARFLAEHTARGDAVIVTVAELDAFCAGFLGIVAAGRVAVPVYPPLAPSEAERTRTVIQATGARHLLCTADQLGSLERLRDEFQLTLHPVDRLEEGGDLPAPPAPDEVAFLQFTSGSTGSPKGIVVTHRQLAEHLEAATGHSSVTADDVFCSWLPIFHDMGLVWMTLQPLWNGAHAVGMLPVTFIREPWRWLQVLSEYGATVTASPNFGYDLAVRKCAGRSLAGLDLRRVRIALNAAERVWPATLRAFHARFEEVGLASTALSAGYGLAEVIVAVCITRHGAAPRTLRVSRDALESDGVARPPEEGERVLELTSCGFALPGVEVEVRDDGGGALPEARLGEVFVTARHVASGYLDQAATRRRYRVLESGSREVRTGDLGFIERGELFVLGRADDVISSHGRLIHPEDVEARVERAHASLRPGCSVAFGFVPALHGAGDVERAIDRNESIVVVAELAAGSDHETAAAVHGAVLAALADLRAPLREVVLVPASMVPKTTSGKRRRARCRKLYGDGRLERIATHPAGG